MKNNDIKTVKFLTDHTSKIVGTFAELKSCFQLMLQKSNLTLFTIIVSALICLDYQLTDLEIGLLIQDAREFYSSIDILNVYDCLKQKLAIRNNIQNVSEVSTTISKNMLNQPSVFEQTRITMILRTILDSVSERPIVMDILLDMIKTILSTMCKEFKSKCEILECSVKLVGSVREDSRWTQMSLTSCWFFSV